MKSLLLYVFILLSLCSCLNDGTDTGNPGLNPTNGEGGEPATDPPPLATTRLDELLTTSCWQISACHATNLPYCRTYLYQLSNIDEEIGLSVGTYSDMTAINQAVVDNEIVISDLDLDQCKVDIFAISCSDASIQNAYDPSLSNPYIGVADMLPTSCEGIF